MGNTARRVQSSPGAVALLLAATCVSSGACAGALVRPVTVTAAVAPDALLVLPGVGYGRDGERAIRALAPVLAAERIELLVPAYIARGGLDESRERLRRFLRDQHLERYRQVHVFAFIAGGWTINPLLEAGELPNVTTVVYDRSPLQERASRIADDKLHLLTWIRYGRPVFDLARTPYPPLNRPDVKVGMLVETRPTGFVRRFAPDVRRYGPLRFDCDMLGQRYDDCAFVPFDHGDMYRRFSETWPELRAFIHTGRFTPAATRVPPAADPLRAAR